MTNKTLSQINNELSSPIMWYRNSFGDWVDEQGIVSTPTIRFDADKEVIIAEMKRNSSRW